MQPYVCGILVGVLWDITTWRRQDVGYSSRITHGVSLEHPFGIFHRATSGDADLLRFPTNGICLKQAQFRPRMRGVLGRVG